MKLTIKRGYDLRLAGGIAGTPSVKPIQADSIAIFPDDFEGLTPKTTLRVGDKVSKGDTLLHDKVDPRIHAVSPISGTVTAIERGERRRIVRIVVTADHNPDNIKHFDVSQAMDASGLSALLAEAGILVEIRRRPFADIPKVDVRPRDIFVTAFDSAPLATYPILTSDDVAALEAGAKALAAITTGSVYLSVRKGQNVPDIEGVTRVDVSGPHPAGLPGVQAANIRPVNAGETIWTLSIETMWRIGMLMTTGTYNGRTFVTVCGSEVSSPYIAQTTVGADIRPILQGHINDSGHHLRVISGNVLTGRKVKADDDYLHFPWRQVTVIPEGDDRHEFMGWASLSPSKMSVSPSFPGSLLRRRFSPDARIHGGRRAIIMSGQYDRFVPMDILSEYLIKAIIGRDIESMERLGIYEVAPEDFALAECLDSSKLPLQQIVREGLDWLRSEC